jgi:OmpA-OmpF porin, OOP family
MKRILTLAVFTGLTMVSVAQEPVIIITEPMVLVPVVEPYNRFALDAQFGGNHAVNPLAGGVTMNSLSMFHVGLGGRYMLNPKFGLRLGVNYDQLTGSDGQNDFNTDYYRTSLEGVINLGNVLSFDQWTHCFGLLLHAGMGYSVSDNSSSDLGPDHMMNVVGGLTPQFRVGDRMNIYLDASMISNANQDFTYDYTERLTNVRGFAGNLYQYSVGVQFNFGPHKTYADWAPGGDRVSDLRNRVEELERGQMDDDADGVVNHIDLEKDTPYGAMVDTKGREIIWYTVYQEVNDPAVSEGYFRYVNTYDVLFDSEKTDVSPRYNRMLDNLAVAMIANPKYNLKLVGHADDRGENDFNLELSKKRAEAIKSYLVGKGVPSGRITATGVGEAQPKTPGEKTAVSREEDRRVQFIIQ